MSVKWSILVLTQPSRMQFLTRLHANLGPQLTDKVELLVHYCDPSISVGNNRDVMISEACGDYISFVDDDDLVSSRYVSTIFPKLGEVDYIGFKLQLYIDGVKEKPTYHSLRYENWYEDDKGFYRDISHLNPIKRDLAKQARFGGGHGEDAVWSSELREKQLVRTEHYIDDVMYHYYFRSDKKDGPKHG